MLMGELLRVEAARRYIADRFSRRHAGTRSSRKHPIHHVSPIETVEAVLIGREKSQLRVILNAREAMGLRRDNYP